MESGPSFPLTLEARQLASIGVADSQLAANASPPRQAHKIAEWLSAMPAQRCGCGFEASKLPPQSRNALAITVWLSGRSSENNTRLPAASKNSLSQSVKLKFDEGGKGAFALLPNAKNIPGTDVTPTPTDMLTTPLSFQYRGFVGEGDPLNTKKYVPGFRNKSENNVVLGTGELYDDVIGATNDVVAITSLAVASGPTLEVRKAVPFTKLGFMVPM
jgi:hypothetical protein